MCNNACFVGLPGLKEYQKKLPEDSLKWKAIQTELFHVRRAEQQIAESESVNETERKIDENHDMINTVYNLLKDTEATMDSFLVHILPPEILEDIGEVVAERRKNSFMGVPSERKNSRVDDRGGGLIKMMSSASLLQNKAFDVSANLLKDNVTLQGGAAFCDYAVRPSVKVQIPETANENQLASSDHGKFFI